MKTTIDWNAVGEQRNACVSQLVAHIAALSAEQEEASSRDDYAARDLLGYIQRASAALAALLGR